MTPVPQRNRAAKACEAVDYARVFVVVIVRLFACLFFFLFVCFISNWLFKLCSNKQRVY